MEILEIKSTINEMKISLQEHNSRFKQTEKKIVCLKIGQLTLSSLGNRKKTRIKESKHRLRASSRPTRP